MTSNDSSDTKLTLFKQQASIIAKKKEAAAEALQRAQDDVSPFLLDLFDPD